MHMEHKYCLCPLAEEDVTDSPPLVPGGGSLPWNNDNNLWEHSTLSHLLLTIVTAEPGSG